MSAEIPETEDSAAENKAWKYVLGVIVALSIAALPHSRFQLLFKIGVWTALFLGLVLTYTWRFLVDAVAKLIVIAISIAYLSAVFLLPSVASAHGYLLIGIVTAVEYLLAIVPIAWLDVRSQSIRTSKP